METIADMVMEIVTPKPSALIPVANGSEEIEVAALSDVLSRAGIHVTTAAVDGDDGNIVKLMNGMEIQADKSIYRCENEVFDLIVIPGGVGTKTLAECSLLVKMLRFQKTTSRWYGGIGAAPVDVLYHNALVTGPMTCVPMMHGKVGDLYRNQPVVVSANCVTSQGPGTAIAMALKLVELLRNEKIAHNLASAMVWIPL